MLKTNAEMWSGNAVGKIFFRSRKVLYGIEILFYYDVNFHRFSYLAFFPQIQIQFSKEFRLDVGPGLVLTAFKIIPEFVSRIQIETIDKDQAKNGIKFDSPKPKEEKEKGEGEGKEEETEGKEKEKEEKENKKEPELNSEDKPKKKMGNRKSSFPAKRYQLQAIAEKIRNKIAGRYDVPREIWLDCLYLLTFNELIDNIKQAVILLSARMGVQNLSFAPWLVKISILWHFRDKCYVF